MSNRRARAYGSVSPATLSRALARVSPEPNTGCWLWTGFLNRGDGTQSNPVFRDGANGPNTNGARFLWAAFRGPVGARMHLASKCGVEGCVNPWHRVPIRPETQGIANSGTGNGQARLTSEQVAEIRRLRASGVDRRTIAERFGIKKDTVTKIARGCLW